MPARLMEIVAVPTREVFRREAFAIHAVRQAPGHVDPAKPLQFSVKGQSEPDELKQGLPYRFYGSWEPPKQFGPTFVHSSFASVVPYGKHGIVTYLKQCRHIGDATAHLLYESFGSEAVQVLRTDPERAAAAVGRGQSFFGRTRPRGGGGPGRVEGRYKQGPRARRSLPAAGVRPIGTPASLARMACQCNREEVPLLRGGSTGVSPLLRGFGGGRAALADHHGIRS